MARCEDCGTTLRGGLCGNCQEEAVIVRDQSEFAPEGGFSQEFLDKAAEQTKEP